MLLALKYKNSCSLEIKKKTNVWPYRNVFLSVAHAQERLLIAAPNFWMQLVS